MCIVSAESIEMFTCVTLEKNTAGAAQEVNQKYEPKILNKTKQAVDHDIFNEMDMYMHVY